MKSRTSILTITVAVMTAMTISTDLTAQDATTPVKQAQHHHYKFIDLGTLGGPQSSVPGVFYEIDSGTAGAQVIAVHGDVTGMADTSIPDPLGFLDDGFYPHTFRWRDGVESDLGTLPGGHFSAPNWISGNGLIAGVSTNGDNDPLRGLPEGRAVIWEGNSITDLGTLPGLVPHSSPLLA